ncbi:hypothetical protein OAF44_03585 [Akkermansiaceae bacterium]|nr:hypothetical protein [Akkermansiaceae bacterium]
MAYVRKTDTLVNDIIGRVQYMSRTAQQPYQTDTLEVGTPEYNDMRNAVVDRTWAAAPDLKGKLPDDWCGTPRRVDVHLRDTNGWTVARFGIENTVANPIRLSPEYSSNYPDVYVSTADLTGAAQTWVDEMADRVEKRNAVREQFKAVENQLSAFMQHHASLNAMLTEMPEFEMYVPEKYMTKVRAKSAPRAKVERPTIVQDLNIDVDALAAAAITHRMVTANSSS